MNKLGVSLLAVLLGVGAVSGVSVAEADEVMSSQWTMVRCNADGTYDCSPERCGILDACCEGDTQLQ